MNVSGATGVGCRPGMESYFSKARDFAGRPMGLLVFLQHLGVVAGQVSGHNSETHRQMRASRTKLGMFPQPCPRSAPNQKPRWEYYTQRQETSLRNSLEARTWEAIARPRSPRTMVSHELEHRQLAVKMRLLRFDHIPGLPSSFFSAFLDINKDVRSKVQHIVSSCVCHPCLLLFGGSTSTSSLSSHRREISWERRSREFGHSQRVAVC